MSHHTAQLEAHEFDRWLTLSEKAAHNEAIAANDAFAAAMRRAIKRKKVTVKPGTFIDRSPSMARRIRGDVAMASGCSSPAAMCADSVAVASLK